MAENGTIKISNINELYSLLPEELSQEFEIGIHGFSDRNYGDTQIDTEKIQQAKDGILRDGLKIRGERKLLSTIMVGRELESRYIRNDGYPGGVIVALPKVLRSESGEEIFIGSPVEDKRVELRIEKGIPWDRNRQATSLSELILPNNGTLDSMFIIGIYTKSENGIEVVLNPNHIAFNKGKVPDDFFRDRYGKLTSFELEGLDNQVVEETISQQQSYKGKLNSSVDLRALEAQKAQYYIDYLSTQGQNWEMSQEDMDMLLDDMTHFRAIGLVEMADRIKTLAEKVKIKDERIERLSMAISELREAGIDDQIIVGMLGDTRKGVPVSDMEELRVMVRTFKKYGIEDIKKEDYASHDNEQSDEMKAIIAELMQPQEEKVDGVEVANEQTGISQDKVSKMRMAIEEMRAAGIDDELITTYMIKGAKGRLGSVEQLGIIGQIKDKYGINEILEEDFFAHNQSQSEEMRQAINGIIQPLSELEKRRMQRKDDVQIEDVPVEDTEIDSPPIQEESEEIDYAQPETPKKEISQETMDRLRVAIQDAKRQGLDGEAIKRYIYKNQAIRGFNSQEHKKWIEISSKHGIDEIMWNDYYGDSSYTGHSSEMYDAIDMLTEEEIVSLTELGEKSYKHFGSRIAEKLKEAVNALKSRFFSKDKDKTDDLTNGR